MGVEVGVVLMLIMVSRLVAVCLVLNVLSIIPNELAI